MQEEKNVPTSSKEHNPTLEELRIDLGQHSSTKSNYPPDKAKLARGGYQKQSE